MNCIYKKITMAIFLLMLVAINSAYAENKSLEFKITSAVSGIIKKVYVEIGQIIKKGDLLLQFDETLINSNLLEAKSMLQLAQINLAESKKEFQRSEELYERTVLSDHDLQNAKVLYYKAIAQHSSAKNSMIHRQWEKQEHKLYAPFSARISDIFCYKGQYINNKLTSQTLFLIHKN